MLSRLSIRHALTVVILPLSLLMSACSTFDEEDELGPAPLLDFKEEKQFDKLWSTSIGSGQGDLYNRLSPVVAGGAVYVASADGEVQALSVADGDDLWDVDLDRAISGGIGLGSDKVFVGTPTGNVIALDRQSGELLWEADVEGEVLTAPQTDDTLVFVQTFDGQLLGLDAATGKRRWSFRATLPVLTLRGTSTPIVYRDQVIAGFANGKVVSFDAATGAVRWDIRVAAPKGHSEIERLVDVDGELMLVDSTLYAVSYQGAIVAVDINTGRKLWNRTASSYMGMGQGFGNIYVSGQNASVTAFAKTGQGVRWEQTILARRKLTGPVVVGSYVIVGDREGYLHALSQVDGHVAARTKLDSDGIQSRMVVKDNTLFVYSNSGKLAVYQLVDKRSGFFSS